MTKAIDMQGQVFGRLTGLRKAFVRGGNAFWVFVCECGQETTAAAFKVRSGRTQSCGCFYREAIGKRSFKHGQSNSGGRHLETRLYRIWGRMKRRCDTPSEVNYARYGGRGIAVCKEWSEDYQAFEKWALSAGYADGLSIDRIDNDSGYSPQNCRWATPTEQAANRGGKFAR